MSAGLYGLGQALSFKALEANGVEMNHLCADAVAKSSKPFQQQSKTEEIQSGKSGAQNKHDITAVRGVTDKELEIMQAFNDIDDRARDEASKR